MSDRGLSDKELSRYDRQVMLSGFGVPGQEKLKRSRVFVAGAGGLGCPAALYLAAAGVGHVTLVDCDAVEESNLNRQVLHWEENVGTPKVESGAGKLSRLNPFIGITPLKAFIDDNNARDLTKGFDVIVDAMDNFEARYALNDASLYHGIPFIHGAIWGLEGRATTLLPGKTPCFRCLFPKSPAKEKFPVLGATAGVIGCIQAAEAIKVLTGIGEPLAGRLLVYDGEYMQFHEMKVEKNPSCEACGKR